MRSQWSIDAMALLREASSKLGIDQVDLHLKIEEFIRQEELLKKLEAKEPVAIQEFATAFISFMDSQRTTGCLVFVDPTNEEDLMTITPDHISAQDMYRMAQTLGQAAIAKRG